MPELTPNPVTGELDLVFSAEEIADFSAFGLKASGRVGEAGGIDKGQVVYVSGATGQKADVKLADNRYHDPAHILGVAAETKTSGQQIEIRTFGLLTDVNTIAFSEGDRLHLSTSGAMIPGVPTSGAHIHLGFVTKSNISTGIMLILPEVYVHDIRGTTDLDINLATGSNDSTRKINFKDYAGNVLGYIDGTGLFIWDGKRIADESLVWLMGG